MKFRARTNRTVLSAALCSGILGVLSGEARASDSYTLFEGGQVRPLALSHNGKRLFAVNTPDARLEVFGVADHGDLRHIQSIPVGLEPVAVAVRDDHEVWVANLLSDSISIVKIDDDESRVVRTLLVGDEPRDIVFGGPHNSRAFVTVAHRGQNIPFDPQLTTPSVGRADVWVYDANHLGADLNGGPINIINMFTDTPRALAVSPDGATVYAAGFTTGNRTAVVTEFAGIPLPPPGTNFQGIPAPQVGLIVKFDGSHWLDELGRPWDPIIQFSLPDKDVFVIDAYADPPQLAAGAMGYYQGVGTVLYNMAVNPRSGKVYVSNTDARNNFRFEGPGVFAGHSVRGHHNENRITVLDMGTVTPRHLNKHIDYSTCCAAVSNTENALSVAIPTEMAVSSNGRTLYAAALGSSKVAIYDTGELEQDTFVPNLADQVHVSGGGPTGLVLDEDRHQLYVLTRFDNSISVINTKSRHEIAHVGMFSPEPQSVVKGRRLLYDATVSSHGDSACATCHLFGDKDDLAWDLGNPDGTMTPNNNPFRFNLKPEPIDPSFPPMKGPLTTQSLRGMANHGPMHWRGDRTGSLTEPNAQPDSGAFNEREAFRQFQKGFTDLLGRPVPLSDEDMTAFTDFILQVMYPPNPIRNLDNSLTPDQQAGHDFYFNRISEQGAVACQFCHRLDPEGNSEFGVAKPGFFGTEGMEAREVFPQTFKIPHLRNLYTKVGMFGMLNLDPLIESIPSQQGFTGDQIRGFGMSRAGDIDTVFRFLHATTFSTTFLFGPNPGGFGSHASGDAERRQVEAFLLAYDSNHKPIVGQQITLTSDNAGVVNPRIALLMARADAGDCDLVAKGRVQGASHGYLYLGGGRFMTDRVATGVISATVLRSRVDDHRDSLTFTCAPVGSGYRAAVDRDDDNVLDGDDPRLN